VIGVMFLIAGVLFIGSLHKTFESKIKIVSVFDDVNGLQKGDNVWLSGVVIGTVSKLHFNGISRVEVSINIDTKAQQFIRKDARIKLGSNGLIGNKILIIFGGSDKQPQIQDGDTLFMEKTISSEDMMNTLQENNKNILAISGDFKAISHKLLTGEGSMGKLLNDNTIYDNIKNSVVSIQNASLKAHELMNSLSGFSSNLNKKGTLANELTTDTLVFNSVKASVLQLHSMADSATLFISNLKQAGSDPKSALGVLLHDKETGSAVKESIKKLESGSQKLNEDLEALQHSIFLRKYFKKQARTAKSESGK